DKMRRLMEEAEQLAVNATTERTAFQVLNTELANQLLAEKEMNEKKEFLYQSTYTKLDKYKEQLESNLHKQEQEFAAMRDTKDELLKKEQQEHAVTKRKLEIEFDTHAACASLLHTYRG